MKTASKYLGYSVKFALVAYVISIVVYLFGYKQIAILALQLVSVALLISTIIIAAISLIQVVKDLIRHNEE